MADLILETYDRFSAMYDIISRLSEESMSESGLASELQLSDAIIQKMISIMLREGFLKAGLSDNGLRLTSQGFEFLEQFAGIRKFLG